MTRIGASQVFFNIVAQFNAEKLIKDYRSINTVMKAVSLDTFEAILKPVEGLAQGIDSITDELNPLQEALGLAAVEFEKFFGTVPAMETMRDEVIALGQAFNQTGVEALNAGSRAAQVANLIGRGNVTILTELAYTLAEISDLNAEEAQRGIIQLHQQTGMLFGELNRESFNRLTLQEQQNILVDEGAKALDALNTIANRSVALEGDLVRVMGTFAAQGELVGDSFEFMAAASATLLEAGEEQGTAGRALRMMYARLGGDISGARTQIEAMGFELTDSNGNMKTMQEVLTELSDKGWNNLAGAEKQAIAQTIAGNRHYVRFIKLMENYDRTMQLASDGAAGFDSALGQANKALQTQVNLLRNAQIENENLRAKIGEGLTPFMRGQVEVQNDYLSATEVLTDSLGGLGVVLGRLKGTMEVMGGFIKIGLATQSFGIGLEMFTSVQRQLNGILVANEHLHSKQANYFEFGVRQTATQRDLMSGVQYIQQKINMHAQERRTAEQIIAYELRDQKDLMAQIESQEEKVADLSQRKYALQRKLSAAKKLELAQETQIDSVHNRRMSRLQYERSYESDMLETVTNLYSEKSATEEAMMRQYMADMETVARMTDGEIQQIHDRHDLLREEHSLLQTLKADNELRYRASGGNYMGDPRDEFGTPYIESSLSLSPEENQIIMRRMGEIANKSQHAFNNAMKTVKAKEDDTLTTRMGRYKGPENLSALQANMQAYDSLNKKLMDYGQLTDLSGSETNMLKQAVKQVFGELIQVDKAVNTVNLGYQEMTESARRVVSVKSALTSTEAHLENQSRELLELNIQDADIQAKIAPLLDKVNQERGDEAKHKEALLALTAALHTEESQLSAEHAKFVQREKEMLQFSEKKTMAYRQMGFAMQNTVGLLGGMIGGTKGAAVSMAFMSGNILNAGKQAGVAATQVMSLTYAQSLNAIESRRAGAAQLFLAKAIGATGAATAATLGSLAMAAAPFAALAAIMIGVQKHAENQREILTDVNDEMLHFENSIQRLSASTTALENADLADSLGLDNYTTQEMINNTSLIDDELQKMKSTLHEYTSEQQIMVEQGMDYLHVLKAIAGESKTMNDEAFNAQKKAAQEQLKGLSGFTTSLGYGGLLVDDMEQMAALFESFNRVGVEMYHSGNAVEELRVNLDNVFQLMESGIVLTEEQIEMFDKAFDNDTLTGIIRAMNQLVASDKRLLDTTAKVNKEMDGTTSSISGMTDEVKNLTDEIYNFSGAREELFFGGKYGNVTGSLYKQVVTQGVGTLYHKNEVIMTTNFHGFFNEKEAAERITAIVTEVLATQ
jgi:TP901 family phage tail tape measure protein